MASGTEASTSTRVHPLAPLSAEEIEGAVGVLRREQPLALGARFVTVELHEPPKRAVLAGEPCAREAFAVLLDKADGATYEAVVSLDDDRVASWRKVPSVRPPFLPDEYDEFVQAVKSDPAYVAALQRRGIEDIELVSIDPAPAGYWQLDGGEGDGRRLCRATSFVRTRHGGNPHARHVEGLVALVDLTAMAVVCVDDHRQVPLPPDPGEYEAGHVGPFRDDLRPLQILQPDGPSFEIDGHEIRWQKWTMRIGFNPREGLTLHDVSYRDGGRDRSVLYRGSYTEIAVSYAEPSPSHFFMSFFDQGEYQAGGCANSLELGCDCLGEIRYFDAALVTSEGEAVVRRNVVCLHEEDVGVLWKHSILTTGSSEVRRSRRLVLSWITTLGNYEYCFYWYFHQDGSLESEVKLSGILQTAALAEGEQPLNGVLVAPRVNGMNHQHLFNVRLDLDVDGPRNEVYEVESEQLPVGGPDNPVGTAWRTTSRKLRSEREAQREVSPLSGRYWTVVNPDVANALGKPVGYKLAPGENVRPLFAPGTTFGKRAGFVYHHLWVTRYEPSQRYASGDYPYQQTGGAGLPEWTQADRSLDCEDVVLWYTMGHHHIPRPEDWPVMPVVRVGFALRPVGFFDRNPALDVPPPASNHACH